MSRIGGVPEGDSEWRVLIRQGEVRVSLRTPGYTVYAMTLRKEPTLARVEALVYLMRGAAKSVGRI